MADKKTVNPLDFKSQLDNVAGLYPTLQILDQNGKLVNEALFR